MEKELKCRACDRYIGKASGSVIAEIICPNGACKATTQFKIIQGDPTADITHKWLNAPKEPKTKEIEVS